MARKKDLICFDDGQLLVVNSAVATAEDIISNYFKLSASQMLHLNYDVKTTVNLSATEIVEGHFAQIVRYAEKKKDALLDSLVKDFYKICLQDHAIIDVVLDKAEIKLFPFMLYVVCHELIHVIRFRRFLQKFDAPHKEKIEEERRVHFITHEVLSQQMIRDMESVLEFYKNWRNAPHELENY